MTYQLSERLTLMPEWAELEAVIMAWPHEDTDWRENLDDVRQTYVAIIQAINNTDTVVVLLCRKRDKGLIRSLLPMRAKLALIEVDYNDTWTRDYCFLTCSSEKGNVAVDFVFNAWGEKFKADLDNQVNRTLANYCIRPVVTCPLVLEGGAIEVDENQTLLSTASCLFNPKRNGDMQAETYEQIFSQYLGAKNTHIFNNGHLEGDDTDGHIDTLVRYTPLHGLVMQSAYNRIEDSHYSSLNALKRELQKDFQSYTIYELPLPLCKNDEDERLPASYANYLICNRHIIAPIYGQAEDEEALDILAKAYPNYTIVAVDCAALIEQFGSLHCITMQVPCGTLHPEIIEQARQGVCEI